MSRPRDSSADIKPSTLERTLLLHVRSSTAVRESGGHKVLMIHLGMSSAHPRHRLPSWSGLCSELLFPSSSPQEQRSLDGTLYEGWELEWGVGMPGDRLGCV